MRPSVASHRTSHAAGLSSQVASAAAVAKLLEKKKEFDAVSALERSCALFLERIEGLGEDCDIMADAGQVHGQVLEQWPKMFEILNLFLQKSPTATKDRIEVSSSIPDGERLVRIPIDELQAATAERGASRQDQILVKSASLPVR